MSGTGRSRLIIAALCLSAMSLFSFVSLAQAAPPANDNFASAQVLTGLPVSATGNNTDATREVDEPTLHGGAGGYSAWYSWEAPSSGPVAVTTYGTTFDTILGVYTGTSLSNLTAVGVNDDEESSLNVRASTVYFTAVAGETYKIVFDGYGESTGNFKLAIDVPGTVTGKVTDGDNLDADLAGVCVAVQSDTGYSRFRTTSGSDGNYTISNVFPGDYAVFFFAANAVLGCGANLVEEYHNNKTTFEAANKITVPSGGNVPDINAQMHAGGTISGIVTNDLGAPLLNVCVQTYNSADEVGPTVFTNASGEYTVTGLPAGDHRIRFSDCGQLDVAGEYFDNAATLAAATPVPVVASEVSTRNIALERTGSISGTVTADTPEANPLESICVTAFYPNGNYVTGRETDSSGEYRLNGLPAGEYKLSFYECGDGFALGEYYNNKPSAETADTVTVSSATETEDIDAQLAESGSITGKLTYGNDEPAEGACAIAYEMNGEYARQFVTEEDGEYQLTGLVPGQYKVEFSNCGGPGYLTEYYDDAATMATAEPVTVVAGEATPDIDALLLTGGSITGKATTTGGVALEGICVELYDSNGDYRNSEQTDENGDYEFGSLMTGQFRLYFSNCAENDVIAEWYNNKQSLNTADPVSVTTGAETVNDNVEMSSSGSISGTVTDVNELPLEDVCVEAVDSNYQWMGNVRTDENGEYRLRGLTTGQYRVGFFDCGNNQVVPEYYNNHYSFDDSDPVSVTVGNDTANINAELAPAAVITGTVTGTTENPLGDICVSVYDDEGGFLMGTNTNSSGYYSASGFPTGNYLVGFQDCGGGNFVSEYYDNKANLETANAVPATAGQETGNIDAELIQGGSLSGTVTDSSENGIDDICVTAYDSTGEESGYGRTDSDGDYSIRGLKAGNHRTLFESCFWEVNYQSEYYDNKATLATANHIPIVVDENTDGIDAEMAPDTTAPDTMIDSGPSGTTIEVDEATFEFSADPFDGEESYECRIDSLDFEPCGSSRTFAHMTNGSHTVQVRAEDRWGNQDPTPASATFTVAVPPSGESDECIAARGRLTAARTQLTRTTKARKGAIKGKKLATKALRKAKKSGKKAKVKKAKRKLKLKGKNLKKASLKVKKANTAVSTARTAVTAACD